MWSTLQAAARTVALFSLTLTLAACGTLPAAMDGPHASPQSTPFERGGAF